MVKSNARLDDSHGKNKEQARKRIKRQRRMIGAVSNRNSHRVWLRTRRRVKRGILGR